MSGRHGGADVGSLEIPGTSPAHRLDAAAKLAGLVAFVTVVACTPRRAVPVFALDAAVVVTVVAVSGVPVRTIAARLGAIAPFIAFALALPFIGTGARHDVLGVPVSVEGSHAAFGIIARAVVGATAAIVVTATTPVAELVAALARLHVPAVIVSIISVMLRYLDVVTETLARTRRAMVARGHDPRWLWQARPVAASVGTLFVRTYERGERIHLAMRARGYDGTMPLLDRLGRRHAAPPIDGTRAWLASLAPAVVVTTALVAWTQVA